MEALGRAVRLLYGVNRWIGHAGCWLILVTVAVCAFVAISRYFFGFGRIWLQEVYVVAFGVSFMLVAPFAYQRDRHVRVDIFQRTWTPKTKAKVEAFCIALFLFPWTALVFWASWPFVAAAWRVREGSPMAGGLEGYFLFKSVILVFAVCLGLQGLAKIGASLLIIKDRPDLLPPEERDLMEKPEVEV